MEAYDRVKKVIVDVLGVDGDRVKMEASFIDDLGADSLDMVELIMDFEEEFALEVTDEEAMTWLMVRDAVRYAERLSD